MFVTRAGLLALGAFLVGCGGAAPPPQDPSTSAAHPDAASAPAPAKLASLVGAWQISSNRPNGEKGLVLLTFTSDGTFFRSGDSHPVLSVAHGVWKRRAGDNEYDATYIALRFDENRKLIGTQKTRMHITVAPSGEEFTAQAKVAILDLEGKEEKVTEPKLAGKRLVVEPL